MFLSRPSKHVFLLPLIPWIYFSVFYTFLSDLKKSSVHWFVILKFFYVLGLAIARCLFATPFPWIGFMLLVLLLYETIHFLPLSWDMKKSLVHWFVILTLIVNNSFSWAVVVTQLAELALQIQEVLSSNQVIVKISVIETIRFS